MNILSFLYGILVLGMLVSPIAQAAESSPQQVYADASPAVVMVLGYGEAGSKGNGGTGLIIRSDGLVLTNAHVVVEETTGRPFPKVSAYLKPDRVTGNRKSDLARGFKASVLAYSDALDLALVRLENPPAPLPVLELSDSDRVRIGDRVMAIGHPEQGGLWTLTTGVVSAEFENFNDVRGKHVFQTEVGLNRGNSGGPLIDANGRVIGINTAIARLAADGLPITSISFSLKSNVARAWLKERGTKVEMAAAPVEKPATVAGAAGAAGGAGGKATASGASKAAPTAQAPPAAHPYSLDDLIRERSLAEADMENMIKEMRQKSRRR
jgi:serine protease Do